MSDKQERMSAEAFEQNFQWMKSNVSSGTVDAMLNDHRRAREAEEELESILHDANSVPLSEVASEMAALRENVDGTAALLVEAEKERDEARAMLSEVREVGAFIELEMSSAIQSLPPVGKLNDGNAGHAGACALRTLATAMHLREGTSQSRGAMEIIRSALRSALREPTKTEGT